MYKKFTWKERVEVLLMGDLVFTMNNSVVEEVPIKPEEVPQETDPVIGVFSIETLMTQLKMRDQKIADLKNANFQQERQLGKFSEARRLLSAIYREYTTWLIIKDRNAEYKLPLENTDIVRYLLEAGEFVGIKKPAPPPAKED